MTETEKAYLAGIVDSDGCIYINKQTRGYGLVLAIKMCDKPVIEWLSKVMDATYWMNNLTITGKESWRTQVTGKKCKSILTEIQPYIVGKVRQVEQALDFPVRYNVGREGYMEGEKQLQHAIYDIMKLLNGRLI